MYFFCDLRSDPSSFTSLRFLTVYPWGSVPSLSMRIGQRAQRVLLTQHFDFGLLDLDTTAG